MRTGTGGYILRVGLGKPGEHGRDFVNIAIFGGSGVVGQVLIPALLERGHTVRALRHRTDLPEGVQAVAGSITDPKAVAEVVDGAEVVLQLTKGGQGVAQVVETSVHGTVTILDALKDAPHVRQYILTSSDAATGIWSHPHPELIDHRTPPQTYPGYYSLGKVLEEVIVHEYHRNHGVAYTIARLSYVMQEDSILRQFVAGLDPKRPGRGPFDNAYTSEQKQQLQQGRPFLAMLCDAADQPLRRTMVQREDVIDALLRMVDNPQALCQTFHVSGPAFGFDEACEHLAAKMSLPIEKISLDDAHSFDIDVSHTTERLGWWARYDIFAMLDAALAWRQQHN